jgi:gliding motility-associated-like protein
MNFVLSLPLIIKLFKKKYKLNRHKNMKKITLILVSFILFSFTLFGQQNSGIFAGNDTAVCNGGNLTLQATLNVLPNVSATGITLSDDQYSQIIPLGFTFNFYGNNYSQCLISTNGYITFDLSGAGGYSQWSINNPIPSAANPTDAIMGPWQDVNPGVGGTILYASFGTAPNRRFVVQWDNPMFSCTSLCFGNQIIIYEGTNLIETHIGNKPICSGWNGGQAIHGIQNASGTLATVVPGRNSGSQWSTTLEGMRFTPSGANYTISNIPFSPIFLGVQANSVITWSIAGGSNLGTGANVTVNPTQNTYYVASVSSITCGGTAQSSSFTYTDTVYVMISNPIVNTSAQNADCLTGQGGIISATASGAAAPFTFVWNTFPPTNNDTAYNVPVGTFTVTLTDANNCTATATATVTQQGSLNTSIVSTINLLCNGVPTGNLEVLGYGSTPPYTYILGNDTSFNGVFSNLLAGIHNVTIKDSIGCSSVQQVILTEPALPLSITQTVHNNVSCFGSNDGSVAFTANGGTPPYDFSSGISNSSTGVFSNLIANPYLFSVSDANGCFVTYADTIIEPQQLIVTISNFTNVVCNGQGNGTASALVSGGVGPYFYNWNSNPLQNTPTASNLIAGNYTVLVSDNNGCTALNFVQIIEPEQIVLTASEDLFICTTFDTTLIANASGGLGTLNYIWMPDSINNDSIVVSPTATTVYTVTVTDSMGCIVSEPVEVTVFESPEPIITKNASTGCQVFCPTFTDLTLFPSGSINAQREWSFGDGQVAQTDSVTDHCYDNPGVYAVTLTVITDKGCKKTSTWENYIEVYPNPEAAFIADPPATNILSPAINFTNLSNGADHYLWNFGDNDSIFSETSLHHTYSDTGVFTVRMLASTDFNCIDSTKSTVVITPYYTFYIPTSFTPNGDGLNDFFEIQGNYIQTCNLEIYDRWGKPFYTRSGSYGVSWDGANAPQGVYVYKIKMRDTQNKDYEYIGQLTVLR